MRAKEGRGRGEGQRGEPSSGGWVEREGRALSIINPKAKLLPSPAPPSQKSKTNDVAVPASCPSATPPLDGFIAG